MERLTIIDNLAVDVYNRAMDALFLNNTFRVFAIWVIGALPKWPPLAIPNL